MIANGNSVNIEEGKSRYHHGDLRRALVEEGLRALAEGSEDDLSLRAIARTVGVSATAVYRHFPDKTALLGALCTEGDRLLADVSRRAQEDAGGGRAGFEATGRAYVHFALDHPALFRLMMRRYRGLPSEQASDGESAGLRLLVDNIAALGPAGLSPERRRVLALQSWALVHGLAMLILDGIVPADPALIEQVIAAPFVARTD